MSIDHYELATRSPSGDVQLYSSRSLARLAEAYLHFEAAHPDHDLSVCAVEPSPGSELCRELTDPEKAAMYAVFDQYDAAKRERT